jgi:hypothetical protein
MLRNGSQEADVRDSVSSIAAEKRAQAAACLAAVGAFGDGRAFGGLNENPAGAFEGDLEHLPTNRGP